VQLLDAFNAHEAFENAKQSYHKYGVLIILVAGFTPIPYKVFTIASGVMGIALVPFVLMSILSRGARFFLVAGLIKLGGEKLEETIHKKIELLGWLCVALVGVALFAYQLH
jgi:membrane protein YqaA with SNARE-associated domain